METLWKVLSSLVVTFFFGLCNGLPINLENSGPDPHTQFLTGLVAVLLTVCSIVLLAGCLCCQRQNGFKEFRDSPVASSATIISSNQDHGHVNPIANSSSEFTIFTPISPPHHNNNVFLANQRIVSCNQEEYKDGDVDASLWFDGSEKDFPRTKLKYIRELGKGWFGRVVEGTAQNIGEDPSDPEWTPVVVRILEASATSREKLLFLNDATIYKCGYHPNILRVLGRSLDTVPLLLLQEYCPQGDLKKYLRMCKSSQDRLVSEDMPLQWCYQLTLALKFLHDQKLTHPDLSARNCQLSEDLSLKLGDYGLSASYYPEDYYQGSPGVPLRWCAPEIISYTSTTIQTTPTTTEANVWALGITMWEILEWGEQPYVGLTDDEVISQVLGTPKVRLPRPTYHLIYTDYMYKIMQSCWYNAESRVTVSQIDLMMTDLIHVYENTKISLEINSDIPNDGEPICLQDFDSRWNALKPNSPLAESSVLKQLQPNGTHQNQDRAQKSASLNNLHGSLDNLLDCRQFDPMESWLENVASDTSDLSFVRGLSEAITDLDNAIAMENMSSSPEFGKSKLIIGSQITSSESETEDEHWRKKIERGAYTEKVRQKSRSVADLMVLTHIDYSESDSETLPSLDFKVNQRVRYLKNVDNQKKFGSEGNLLHVHDNTFQEELKKLQEERRDSLLFVPDKFSECSFSGEGVVATASVVTPTSITNNRLDSLENSPVKKLMEKLNSPSEMVPPQRVYNVFNVRVQHMNVGGTVCDKASENFGQIYHDVNTGDTLEKETSSEGICDRLPESKVLEQNAIISQNKDSQNQINSFSVYISDQSLEELESTNHIKTIYNSSISKPYLNNALISDRFPCENINEVQIENTMLSNNYGNNGITNRNSETYPHKKDYSIVCSDICKIDGINEQFKDNYPELHLENHPDDSKLNKVGTINEISSSQIISNEKNNADVIRNKQFSSNESLTRSDSLKENNFDVKIEILNEQNSNLNENIQNTYSINMPQNLNNISSKENFSTSNENSKNVKLKVPKLSEMIQRNAIDYKVHHHSNSKNKISVIFKNEENDKTIHQEVVDKDSGLNTPENSASLEKLYDDNEEILDVGSFDSDRSNEASNKGNVLSDISNEEEQATKEKCEELSVISYFENQKEFDREEEISNLIDFCASKECRLICGLFLDNERTWYSENTDPKLNHKLGIDDYNRDNCNKEIISRYCTDIGIFSNQNKLSDVKNSFLNPDYGMNIQTFIESEVYHSSSLIEAPVLSNKLISDKNMQIVENINSVEHDKVKRLNACHSIDRNETNQRFDTDESFDKTYFISPSYNLNVDVNNVNRVPGTGLNEVKNVEETRKTNAKNNHFIDEIERNVLSKYRDLCDKKDLLNPTAPKIINIKSEMPEKTGLQEKVCKLTEHTLNNSRENLKEFLESQDDFEIMCGDTESDKEHVNRSSLLIVDCIPNNELCSKIDEEIKKHKDIEDKTLPLIIQDIVQIEGTNLAILKTGFKTESLEDTDLPLDTNVSRCESNSSQNKKLHHSYVDMKAINMKNIDINEGSFQTENVDNCEVNKFALENFDIVPKQQSDAGVKKNMFSNNATEKKLLEVDKSICDTKTLTQTFLYNEIENSKKGQSTNYNNIPIIQKRVNFSIDLNESIVKTPCKNLGSSLSIAKGTITKLQIKEPSDPSVKNYEDEATGGEIKIDQSDNTETNVHLIRSNYEKINNLKQHFILDINKTSVSNDCSPDSVTKINCEHKTLENKIFENLDSSFPLTERIADKELVKESVKPKTEDNERNTLIENRDQTNEAKDILHLTQSNVVESNVLKQRPDIINFNIHPLQHPLSEILDEKIDLLNEMVDSPTTMSNYIQDFNYDKLNEDNQNLIKVKDEKQGINANNLLSTTLDKYSNTNVEEVTINKTYTFLRNEIINYAHNIPINMENTFEIDNTAVPQNEMQLFDSCTRSLEIENPVKMCPEVKKEHKKVSNHINNNGNGSDEQFNDMQNQNLTKVDQSPEEYETLDDILSPKLTRADMINVNNCTNIKTDNDVKQTATFLCYEVENYANSGGNILLLQDIDTEFNINQKNGTAISNTSEHNPDRIGNANDLQVVNYDGNLMPLENQTEEVNHNDAENTILENIENDKNSEIEETSIFLKNEIENYISTGRRVDFDLSDTQDKMSLNSLTHLSAFTSTPFANRRPNEPTVILGASDDYSIDYYSGLKTSVDPEDNSDLQFSSNFVRQNNTNDLYSLETWDNFLGRSFDEQENAAVDFSDFSQEPHSLLFLECDADNGGQTNDLKVTRILDETYDADNGGQTNDLKVTRILDETYDAGAVPAADGTFVKDQKLEVANKTVVNTDKNDDKTKTDSWKTNISGGNGGGWFLHPQCSPKEPTKNQDTAVASTSDESYVRFSMDDEIMAAIRNELLTKLPHAQRASSDHQIEENCEEMDSAERNEVFLRYNVYNTPLSPIPEESCDSEIGSGEITPKRVNDTSDDEGDSSDWSVQEDNNSSNAHTEEIISPRIPESPARCRTDPCRYTPSQDSCCSNDTLFNVEELNGGVNDKVLLDMVLNLQAPLDNILDSMEDETSDSRYDDCSADAYITENEKTPQSDINPEKEDRRAEIPVIKTDHNYILEFLDNERYSEMNLNFDVVEEFSSASDIYLTVSDNTFSFGQNIAPLNSPEDRPWKELQASFRNCDEDQSSKITSSTEEDVQNYVNDNKPIMDSKKLKSENPQEVIHADTENQNSKTSCKIPFERQLCEEDETDDCFISDEDIDKVLREELESEVNNQIGEETSNAVANVNDGESSSTANNCYNDDRIYVNLTKTESGESFNTEDSSCDSPIVNSDKLAIEYEKLKNDICNEESGDSKVEEVEDSDDKFSRFEDLFGPLTDIRFSGPGSSSQLMTTSFSESNDFGDDQDWDSGSDTRSSSSGEFIWKEGEHEASVKALRAPPQLENIDYVTPMENIQEEEVSENSSKDNSSSSSGSEEEDECPEFVPSAWDKYATPTKSALRSPEKTIERAKEEKVPNQQTQKQKKSKGVSFKKQKYHCVYEYPREPESPILQSYDLWKPTPDYATLSDWDLDTNTYLPTILTEHETSYEPQSKHDSVPKALYHLSTFSDVNVDPNLDEDFFVSSSSKPFDMLTGLTSQFFPGRQFSGDTWTENINITPDSGVEDIPAPANFTNNTVSSCDNKNETNSQITEVQSLKVLAANAVERSGTKRELGGLRHTRNKLKLDLPPSPSAFTSNRTFSVESAADEIVSRQVPTFTTFGKSRFLVQHVDTPPDGGRADKNVSFEALPHKKPETVFMETNEWKNQKKDKQKESVRGEASLLDSTDEDSGIESCTLDRKRFNV